MTETNWTIHPLLEGVTDYDEPMYAILPDDGTNGLIVGELTEVHDLLNRLVQFSETGQHDGAIDDLDERLGHLWLGVSEAAKKFNVAPSSITWACRQNLIRGAEKRGQGWRFPQRTFLGWKMNRPGSGRRSSQ